MNTIRDAVVTPEEVQNNILSVFYFTADQGVKGAGRSNPPQISNGLGLITFCVIILRNGRTVTGEASCLDPGSYSQDFMQKVARQRAEEKIWPLMIYSLQQRLMDAG